MSLEIMPPESVRENLESVRRRIADAARRSGRGADAVTLVAVTKKQPLDRVRTLANLGVKELGENYPQELWSRVDAFSGAGIHWHLIGHLQGNKAKRTLPLVRMIHAVDSLKLLQGLDALAQEIAEPARVCLQVNTSNEPAKHGWSPAAILADAEAIATCRRIPVVGLMTMAALGTSAEEARPSFVALREVRDALAARTGLRLEQLSMGMSNDFETAIEEGATLVRVGSALFEGALQ